MSSQLQDALGMFAFLAIELSVLFIGISLLVGVLQRHIPPSKVEALLTSSGKRGYFLAAGLGAITPFCSCSTIPMLKGLIRARAGFGPMMVFLFSSPLLNPIVALGFERYVRRTATQESSGCSSSASPCSATSTASSCGTNSCDTTPKTASCGADRKTTVSTSSECCDSQPTVTVKKEGKYSGVWREAWSDFIDVLPYLLIGIAIGSVIYGFMPTDLLEQYAGPDNPFAIPVAAVIGVPLYIRAEAVIPLAAALMAKGVGAGTVLALIIGSAGASLTELILLRSLFTLKLLAAFLAVIFAMAMIAGYATYLFF